MKRKITALLTAAMLSVTICGCSEQNEKSHSAAPMSSGRYVEEEIILPVTLSEGVMSKLAFTGDKPAFVDCQENYIYRMNEKKNGFTASSFNGPEENYMVVGFTVSSDGEAWFLYNLAEGESENVFIGHSGEEWQKFSLDTKYFFSNLEITQDGRIFTIATTKDTPYQSFICEVDTKNETLEFIEDFPPNHVLSLDIVNDYVISIYGDEVFLCNYMTDEQIEAPKALTDFAKSEKLGENIDIGNVCFDICSGEDGTIYIACASGLYRYVFGGNQIEQLVDGESCHLGNPSWQVLSVLQENEDSFLVSYTNGKIMRYYYDKNAGNAYDTELRIFSLENNETAMYATYEYRSLYPNVDVIYQTAKSDDYAEAMKELESLLESETPPDIILTDGMDLEDLTANQTLLPLSDYESAIFSDSDILKNIAKPDDDIWYTMPCRFSIPCVVGDAENLSDNYTELLSLIEKKYSESEDLCLFYYEYSAESMLEKTLPIAWADLYDNGTLSQAELITFFEKCKSIYLESQNHGGFYNTKIPTLCDMYLWYEKNTPFVANVNKIIDLMNLYTLPDADKNAGYRLEQVFIPSCNLSINANSKNRDDAVRFLQTAISSNVQSIESEDGLPVSKTVLSSYSKRHSSSLFVYDDDSYLNTIRVENLTEEETADLIAMAENMETAVLIGGKFEEAFTEYGARCLYGEMDAESAAKAVLAAME